MCYKCQNQCMHYWCFSKTIYPPSCFTKRKKQCNASSHNPTLLTSPNFNNIDLLQCNFPCLIIFFWLTKYFYCYCFLSPTLLYIYVSLNFYFRLFDEPFDIKSLLETSKKYYIFPVIISALHLYCNQTKLVEKIYKTLQL